MTKSIAQLVDATPVDDAATDGVPHDLEAHIEELKLIDKVRRNSAMLRTEGHQALLRLSGATGPQKGADASLPSGKSPRRRGRNKANAKPTGDIAEGVANESKYQKYKRLRIEWQFSKREPEERARLAARIEEARLNFNIEEIQADYVPVLAAAEAMRAFTCLGHGAVGDETMQAWYLVVRELFTAAKPDWTIGGARAGSGGWVSAYVTSQCIQAICDLAKVLERTADLLLYLRGISQQLASLKFEGIPEKWRERDEARLKRDLLTTLALAENSTALNIRVPSIDSFDLRKSVLEDLQIFVAKSLTDLNARFEKALKNIDDFRETEQNAIVIGENATDEKRKMLAESATGHAIAREAVDIGKKTTGQAISAVINLRLWEKRGILKIRSGRDWIGDVANCLRDAARGVRSGAAVSKGYLSSVIDHQISASGESDSRLWEPVELAFAVPAYILATGEGDESSERERFRHAAQLVCRDLSADGTIASRIPFHVHSGSQYFAHTEELLGAVSELVRAARYPIDERLASSIYYYFIRQCARSEHTRNVQGWYAEFDHHRQQPNVMSTIDTVEALGSFNRMLDEGINETILDHFSVRKPSAEGVRLENLFYPDYGFSQVGQDANQGENDIQRESVAITLQRMRAHVLRAGDSDLYSLVLHGPGGTGKTTLIEALANTCGVPLVEVTPSDIAKTGEAHIERRARAVFEALSMLSRVVILFDEFDPILRRRDSSGKSDMNFFAFLTPGMLPKLKALHENAKERRVAYALITNLIGSLDVPAVRKGRFDEAVGIYPPDPLSRAGYMARICWDYACRQKRGRRGRGFDKDRFICVVAGAAGLGMTPITAKGKFRFAEPPKLDKGPVGWILGHSEHWKETEKPEDKFREMKGEGLFAERESVQWGWLSDWEQNWKTRDPGESVDRWRKWQEHVNRWPTSMYSEESMTRQRAAVREINETTDERQKARRSLL